MRPISRARVILTPGITKILLKQSKRRAKKQLIIAGVVTEVCVAFPALSAIEEGFEVFVVTDASGTFNPITRDAAWDRMSQAGGTADVVVWRCL